MKKLIIGFLTLSLITFGFVVFVFRGNHPTYSLTKKSYTKQLKIVEQQFVNQLKKTESNIYNSFLQKQLNVRIIQDILKKDIFVNNEIKFIKFRDDLINFSIFNQDRKLLYQIKKQNNYFQHLDSFSSKKEIFSTPDGFTIFQIPFENNFQSGILLFEFNTYSFLEASLNTLSRNLTSDLIVLPKILILDEQSSNKELTKKLITSNLGSCLKTKQICDIYISSLQKRLLVDSNKYLNISAGILYPSNPMDIPRESTLIIFILLILTALTILLIFFISFKKKYQSNSTLPLSNSPDEDLNQKTIEIDTYIEPSEIPDLDPDEEDVPEIQSKVFEKPQVSGIPADSTLSSLHQEINTDTTEEAVPEIQSKVSEKPQVSGIPADSTLSSLHQEINTNTTVVSNEEDLKEAYKKISFDLIKGFFPNLDNKEVKLTLAQFPHANSLLLLKLKGNSYQATESFNVDGYTSENCSIEKNHPLIKNYLNKRKGLLIHDFAKTNTLPKNAFSDQEQLKINSLFMFSFDADKSKYIFLIY